MSLIKLMLTGKGPMTGWIARAYDGAVQTAFREFVMSTFDSLADQIADAQRVLDVGCGPGQFTIMAAERRPQARVVGVDLSPTMIELAQGHAANSPAIDRVSFKVGDAMTLPFPDASFDVAISSGSIKQWPDTSLGLAEIYRVLIPGGTAFILEVNRDAPPHAVEAQRVKLQHWVFRAFFPRVVTQGMTPAEARAACVATRFGEPSEQQLLLDGLVWLLIARKKAATPV